MADSTYRGLEAFEETRRALVVGAHADDMETLMGGTLALLAARGVEVFQVICTIGDLGSNEPQWTRESLAATRQLEAQAGARAGLRIALTLRIMLKIAAGKAIKPNNKAHTRIAPSRA
jgi:LmbE family N-acetylglucosaminyl deacetylase